MTVSESAMLAARLFGMSSVVFLAPGLAFLIERRMEWPERLMFAFVLSYSWIFALSVVVPAFWWTADHAMLLTCGLILLLLLRHDARTAIVRWRPRVPRFETAAVLVVFALFAVCAWFIEEPVTGDVALDVISVARFADGGRISFDNTSVLPHTRAIYLLQPYQLAVGVIARWSGTEALVALLKLRPFLAILSLSCGYGLLRRLVQTRAHAFAAVTVILIFIALVARLDPWETYSLFPLVQRSRFAAGVCVPALMAITLAATRRTDPERRLALLLAPVFLIASITTHALEMYTAMCFAASVVAVVLLGLDPQSDRRHALHLVAACLIALAVYLPVHAYALPELSAFERDLKAQATAEFTINHPDIRSMVAGRMAQEPDDLLHGRIPATVSGVLGIPALACAVWLFPSATAVLGLATVPLLVMYASPIGYLALVQMTSADSANDVTSYFGLVGLLAFSLGVTAAAQGVMAIIGGRRSQLQRAPISMLFGIAVVALYWRGDPQCSGCCMLSVMTRACLSSGRWAWP